MTSNNIFLFKNPFSRFEIKGDKKLFNAIVSDMMNNAGKLAPSDHWNWNLAINDETETREKISGYSDDLFDKSYSELQMMLDPWVGVMGMKYINEEVVGRYEDFLKGIDHLGLLPDDIVSCGESNGWKETDLGSILDINLITAYAQSSRKEKISICEVGGGYGRLAELFLSGVWQDVHYVLVDAVPASLMYAYLYLKSQFPDKNIGSYYNGDIYSKEFDCYIMPAWTTQLLGDSLFDITINIESLQETTQFHYDFYIDLFDRITVSGGEIYISNARDYIFKGNWNIPHHWETLYLNNTPRSWSPDHPTQIMRKCSGDFSLEKSMIESAFEQQIQAWDHQQELEKQTLDIADRDRICGELQQTISDMKAIPKDCSIVNRVIRRVFG